MRFCIRALINERLCYGFSSFLFCGGRGNDFEFDAAGADVAAFTANFDCPAGALGEGAVKMDFSFDHATAAAASTDVMRNQDAQVARWRDELGGVVSQTADLKRGLIRHFARNLAVIDEGAGVGIKNNVGNGLRYRAIRQVVLEAELILDFVYQRHKMGASAVAESVLGAPCFAFLVVPWSLSEERKPGVPKNDSGRAGSVAAGCCSASSVDKISPSTNLLLRRIRTRIPVREWTVVQ